MRCARLTKKLKYTEKSGVAIVASWLLHRDCNIIVSIIYNRDVQVHNLKH